MKARVYGWAHSRDSHHWIFLNGEIFEPYCIIGKDDEAFFIKSSLNGTDHIEIEMVVHRKQVEPIKEITITEEEFDKAMSNCFVEGCRENGRLFSGKRLKEELFKDVK